MKVEKETDFTESENSEINDKSKHQSLVCNHNINSIPLINVKKNQVVLPESESL